MLPFPDYEQHDALALAGLVRTGQLTAAELLEAAIARTEARNPALNAVIYKLYDDARQRAAAPPAGPFAGVPFLLKDLTAAYAGAPLTAGSRAYQHYRPAQDSELVRRYQAAGLNIFGKTNTPELALLATTEPQLHGPTRNPWDPTRTPGGSSGGAAAAVAAGLVPVAAASDGGGSIRIPAAHCGLFGLKPSRGRNPVGPLKGEVWQGASVEHVISRSVRDSAAVLDATHGPGPGAPYFVAPPVGAYLAAAARPPGRLRIGFSTAHPLGLAVDPACVAAVQNAARLLESLGHEVGEVALPYDGKLVARTYLMLYFGEVGAEIAAMQAVLGRPATRRDVEPATWLLGLLGRTYSAADFVTAHRSWYPLTRALDEFHATHDLLLTPTAAAPPVRLGELAQSGLEKALLGVVNRFGLGRLMKRTGLATQLAEKSLAKTPYTQIANLTGRPAMSVPLHWTPENLPIGVQFLARFGAEELLFSLAGQLEQAQPWFSRMVIE